jgi:hypothetical protein
MTLLDGLTGDELAQYGFSEISDREANHQRFQSYRQKCEKCGLWFKQLESREGKMLCRYGLWFSGCFMVAGLVLSFSQFITEILGAAECVQQTLADSSGVSISIAIASFFGVSFGESVAGNRERKERNNREG